MDNNALSEQLQSVVKAIKFRRGDKNIKKMPHFKYCCEVIKRINERENEHEIQTKKLRTGLVMYPAWETTVSSRVILGYPGSSSTR